VLSLPTAALPLPVAVSCLDATVRRKGSSHIRHRGHPSGWWAFSLPVPAPEEAKGPVPPSSAANNPTEEGRSCPRWRIVWRKQVVPYGVAISSTARSTLLSKEGRGLALPRDPLPHRAAFRAGAAASPPHPPAQPLRTPPTRPLPRIPSPSSTEPR
jgi:hypothetical protein